MQQRYPTPKLGERPLWPYCSRSDSCDIKIADNCCNRQVMLVKCRKCGQYPYPPHNDECFGCLAFEQRMLRPVDLVPKKGANMRPLDVSNDAKNRNVPGFRKVDSLRACYFCCHLFPNLNTWVCNRHSVYFGEDGDWTTICHMVEFVCDDFNMVQ